MGLFRKKKPAPPPPTVPAISPVVTMVVTDAVLRAGEAAVRRGIERRLLDGEAPRDRVIRGRTLGQTVVGTVLAEVARRSVPGAVLVGGGLVIKSLRDRAKAKRAREAAKDNG